MAHHSEPVRHRLKQNTNPTSPAESRPIGDSPGLPVWPKPKRNDQIKADVQKPKAALWRVLKAHL